MGLVMPGLVPGIHALAASHSEDVDGRDEPGHDAVAGFHQAARLLATAAQDRGKIRQIR